MTRLTISHLYGLSFVCMAAAGYRALYAGIDDVWALVLMFIAWMASEAADMVRGE